MSDQNEQLWEVERRTKELEKLLIAHRRFTIFIMACLCVLILVIVLWVFRRYGW